MAVTISCVFFVLEHAELSQGRWNRLGFAVCLWIHFGARQQLGGHVLGQMRGGEVTGKEVDGMGKM